MTVTVTNNAATGGRDSAIKVAVLTGAELTSPVETSGIGSNTATSTTVSQSYTPLTGGTGGSGFLAMTDFTDANTATPTAGTGCTLLWQGASANMTWLMVYRTAFDDVAGTANTVSGAITTADPMLWAWADITVPLVTPTPARPDRVKLQAVNHASFY
jgi:hypothetical protein